MSIGDTTFAEPGDAHFDPHYILEPCRGGEIAFRADAWPTDRTGSVVHHDTQPDAAQQIVLSLLHHSKKGRKVRDASGVGVAKFDPARGDEGGAHGRRL